MKTEKIRVGLFITKELNDSYQKDCDEFNRTSGLDITLNAYIVMVLVERRKD